MMISFSVWHCDISLQHFWVMKNQNMLKKQIFSILLSLNTSISVLSYFLRLVTADFVKYDRNASVPIPCGSRKFCQRESNFDNVFSLLV